MNFRDALALAYDAHLGQVDKQGAPYILHPVRVAFSVAGLGEDYAVVGVLHDVIEDTDWTLDRMDLTTEQETALELVTRERWPTRPHYRKFIERIAAADGHAGIIARAVKVADLRDNLGRMTPALEASTLGRRYQVALAVLTG